MAVYGIPDVWLWFDHKNHLNLNIAVQLFHAEELKS